MAHRMVSTDGALSFVVGAKQYSLNRHGYTDVDDQHVQAAISHGFRRAGHGEVRAAAEELTPVVVAGMTRSQLIAFLEDRGEENLPTRTQGLRQRVMEIADHEADEEALGDGDDENRGEFGLGAAGDRSEVRQVGGARSSNAEGRRSFAQPAGKDEAGITAEAAHGVDAAHPPGTSAGSQVQDTSEGVNRAPAPSAGEKPAAERERIRKE